MGTIPSHTDFNPMHNPQAFDPLADPPTRRAEPAPALAVIVEADGRVLIRTRNTT